MPEQNTYSRNDLIAAWRQDHPELKKAPDNEVFAAIAVDHPDLAKGISELQPKRSEADIGTANEILGPLIGGVGPSEFGQRIMGAIASVINPLFPAGDVKQPNLQLPAMTPSQDIGAKAVTIGSVTPLVESAAGALANRVRGVIADNTSIADSLMARGQNNLAATKEVGPAIPTSGGEAVRATVQMARGPVRRALGRAEVAAAKAIAGDQSVAGNLVVPFEGDASIAEPQPQTLTPEKFAAAMRTHMMKLPESEPLNIPRPQTPQFIEDQLANARAAETPEQMFERLKAQRDATLPESQFGQSEPLNIERPGASPIPLPSEGTRLTSADVNRWLGVSSKEVLRGADPGKQILDQGLIGVTKAATKANVEAALADAGQSLGAQLKAATEKGVTIDAQTPVYEAIMGAVKKLGSPRDATFQANLNGLLDDIETKYPGLTSLTPEQTHALKVDLGDSAQWSGTGANDAINRVKMQIYSDLNNAIKEAVPDAAKIQDRWRNLYIANKATARSMAKDVVGTGSGDVPKVKTK